MAPPIQISGTISTNINGLGFTLTPSVPLSYKGITDLSRYALFTSDVPSGLTSVVFQETFLAGGSNGFIVPTSGLTSDLFDAGSAVFAPSDVGNFIHISSGAVQEYFQIVAYVSPTRVALEAELPT